MFSGQLILTSSCYRKCGITAHVPASAKPSRQEFIMWPFALRSGNHSTAAWGDSKLGSYPNIKRSCMGGTLEIHERRGPTEGLRVCGLRSETRTWVFIRCI